MPVDWKYIGEEYGWIAVCILILILNGEKVSGGIILIVNAVTKLFRQGRQAGTDKAKAELAQETTIIRHEMDAETTAQNNLISVQNRFIDIYDRMQEHFFKQDERHIENTVAVQDAINAVRMAILRLESTVSLLTQTVSRQADAYASLECVKAKQKVDEEARQR